MRTQNQLIAALVLAVLPSVALAWNAQGHQAVGAIADKLLAGSNAEIRVKEILGGMNLQTVAVWPDCARGVKSKDDVTFTYAEDSRYPECNPFNTPDGEERFKNYISHNWNQCGTAHGNEKCHGQYHYTDVSNLHDHYELGYVGTSNHDVVHSINAAIAVLRDQVPDSPFIIKDKQEALMLLAHFVGDIHQPLHATAIYLDANGQVVDPDAVGYRVGNDTSGGNNLTDGEHRLHWDWDEIPESMQVGGAESRLLLHEAWKVPETSGDSSTWSTTWATDTIRMGRKDVFDGLSFKVKQDWGNDSVPHLWEVSGELSDYQRRAYDIKLIQLAKAGARLAQLLKAIWPDKGYLTSGELKNIKQWLPSAPATHSAAEAEDIAEFKATRAVLNTARGQQAAEDDVYNPALVAGRFKDAAGVALTPENAPTLMALIAKVEADASLLVAPVKLSVNQGGRKRPFVLYPKAATCLSPKDMAGHRDEDLNHYDLAKTGSYPSTHALIGLMMGLILSETEPDRADAVMERGLEFGKSRIICGFHYYSDVVAGRLAASALYARLHADAAFTHDVATVSDEIAAARRQQD